ncbi:hypothetical protein GTQ40_00920 [Flavobacteriaceae bacterium R38]|nr:hypothetical protein [Flavobacteriaceae bacterium R38]
MKNLLTILLLVFISVHVSAQDNDRVILRGQVLYRNSFIPNENVVNITTQKATITNENGEFEIYVKSGDELVFTAVNYRIRSVTINDEILKNNRLVVEVREKVTELDEVVISPEDKQAFLQLKNEEFKQFNYEEDASTEIKNTALSVSERGLQNGLNFVNIFKAIFKQKKNTDEPEKREIKLSAVLRQVYDDDFFTKDLNVPSNKINEFLYYCDEKRPSRELLQRANEFELIGFLLEQSESYRKALVSEE